ncbi:hypothetical protein D3C76_67450 [compost metagenome]
MKEIIRAVDHMRENDLKPRLKFMLAQIKRLKDKGGRSEAAVVELIEMYDEIVGREEKKNYWDPTPGCAFVHVVVGDSFAGSMKQALSGLGWADSHKVIVLRENYAIGPLGGLDSAEGRLVRSNWFRDHITEAFEAYSEFEEEYTDLLGKFACIPPQAQVVLWTSRAANEQAGMRHAVHLLRGTSNMLAVYDVTAICEEMFNTPMASIDYKHSGEIPPDKLREALERMDGSGHLDASVIGILQEEWLAISGQSGVLRIWQDGKIVEVPATYYDNYLLEKLDFLTTTAGDQGFLRAARLIGEALGYCDQFIGDSYFEYRVRQLIYDGILEIKGVPAAMRFYSIRRKPGPASRNSE